MANAGRAPNDCAGLTAASRDEDGYYCFGDAMKLVDPDNPAGPRVPYVPRYYGHGPGDTDEQRLTRRHRSLLQLRTTGIRGAAQHEQITSGQQRVERVRAEIGAHRRGGSTDHVEDRPS